MSSVTLWPGRTLVPFLVVLVFAAGPVTGEAGVNLTTVNIINESGQNQSDVPVTFGHVLNRDIATKQRRHR